MHNRIWESIIVLIVLWTPLANWGAIVVPDDASTIQEAVNLAATTDTILIQPGTYSELPVSISGKSLVIEGLGIAPEDVWLYGEGASSYCLPVLSINNLTSVTLCNLKITGMQGDVGLPPAQCNGGQGGTGGSAISFENVDYVTIVKVIALGGPGGIGLPNEGGCPAPGTNGDGGFGFEVNNVPNFHILNSAVFGGCGVNDGDSMDLTNGTNVTGSDVVIDAGPCGTGIVTTDVTSSYLAGNNAAVDDWQFY